MNWIEVAVILLGGLFKSFGKVFFIGIISVGGLFLFIAAASLLVSAGPQVAPAGEIQVEDSLVTRSIKEIHFIPMAGLYRLKTEDENGEPGGDVFTPRRHYRGDSVVVVGATITNPETGQVLIVDFEKID